MFSLIYMNILVVINLEVSVETESEQECILSGEKTDNTHINL